MTQAMRASPPAVLLFLVAAALRGQDVEIRGASIALLPRTTVVSRVTLENHRDSALLAWQIKTAGVVASSDFTWQAVALGPNHGPIGPDERRVIDVGAPEDRAADGTTLQLAVFADGRIEGTSAAIEQWRSDRREHAADAGYWVQALNAMPIDSEARAKDFLAARVAERAAQSRRDLSGIRGRLFRIWHESPQPPGWLLAAIDPIRREAARQVEALTRTLSAPQTLESKLPVSVSSQRSVKTAYVVAVKNLRAVPIEALAFEHYPPGHNHASGGQTADFCLADPDPRFGRGRIAPGETREFDFSARIDDPSQLPTLKLRYVLFDDLSFEGAPIERDRLFRRREQQADDLAFAAAVLRDLPAGPVRRVEDYLEQKRAEQGRRLLGHARLPDAPQLDRMLELARRSPERLAETAAAMIQDLERQRQRLLRHKN